MKALLLSAGFGTRLQHLTKSVPKPLIEVHGIPLIYFSLSILKDAGIREILINLHYKGEKIREKIGNGHQIGLSITYIHEKEILGTGGAIKNAEFFFQKEENFVVINSDIISDLPLQKMINNHLKSKALATMGVFPGVKKNLFFERDNKLLAINVESHGNCRWGVFSGVQVLNREILGHLPDGFSNSIECYKEMIKLGKKMKVYIFDNSFFFDYGEIQKTKEINLELKKRDSFLKNVNVLAKSTGIMG